MKKIIVLLLAGIIMQGCSIKTNADIDKETNNLIFAVCPKREQVCRYGYVDLSGKIVIPFEYEFIEPDLYEKDFVFAKKDNRYLIIDKSGKVIKELNEEVYVTSVFSPDGFARVSEYLGGGKFKHGVIDTKGNLIIPLKYEILRPIIGGYFIVRSDGNKFGIIDKTGNYTSVEEADGYDAFEDDFYKQYLEDEYIVLTKGKDENKTYGIVSLKGEIIYPFIYKTVEHIGVNMYRLTDNEGKITYFDKSWKLDNIKEKLEKDNITVKSYANNVFSAKKYNKSGIIDEKGNIIIPFEYSDTYAVAKNLYVVVNSDNQMALINSQRKIIAPFGKFETLSHCDDNNCIVGKFDKDSKLYYGMINKNGKKILPPDFYFIEEIIKGYYAVLDKDYNSKIIDKNGKDVIPYGKYEGVSISKNHIE